jgi:tetratricopeptide (TPR) repeat protein
MSLLMKALEKAAKDRGDARTEPAAAAPVNELALEPLAAEASGAPGPEAPPRQPAAPARTYAAPANERAQAASVLQAGAPRPAAGGPLVYARTHPVVAFGTLAGVLAVGFGIYVYLQLFHPSLFVAQPPLASRPPVAALVQAPSAVAAPTPPAAGAALPSAPLLKESAPAASSAAAARARRKPEVSAAAEATSGNTIVVSRGTTEPAMNPLLPQAYAALQAGRLDDAQRAYSQLAAAEPASVDAALGLAAVAVRRGDTSDAIRHYLRILELDPRNALAQSGLIALLGRADPMAAESKLQQLIAREPSAHLYFTLGNLYADQSQWSAAQQSYFQAHHLDAANPDYAYNLAVGLEHVSQRKLALGYYRRAVELAAARGRANFNLPQAQERIGKLAAQVD